MVAPLLRDVPLSMDFTISVSEHTIAVMLVLL